MTAKTPERIWAYDDGAFIMAFDFATAAGDASEYIRADIHEARITKLKAALKPFAHVANMEERADPAESVMVNVNRCREARAVLDEDQP